MSAKAQLYPSSSPLSLPYTRGQQLVDLMRQRIVILDGAMGTMIQQYHLDEAGFRGLPQMTRYEQHPIDVKNNSDLLNITQPNIIQTIHRQYLEAGADIIETNTFGANAIAQADYDLIHDVVEMNTQAVVLAKAAIAQLSLNRPAFIAGAIGPTPRTASISPDVNDPGARNVTFAELKDAYFEQAKALLEAGVDVFLVETIFDTLNAKAALFALDELFEQSQERLPIMISGTVTDASGRILAGQTVSAFWFSLRHAKPLTFGLNCALGGATMRPYIAELAKICDCGISCHPNAGLPNPMSETGFDECPDDTASHILTLAQDQLVNVVGGCCGTTPAHIAAIAQSVHSRTPREFTTS